MGVSMGQSIQNTTRCIPYQLRCQHDRGSDHPTAEGRRVIRPAGGLRPRVMRNTPCCILFMSYPPEKTAVLMLNAPEDEQICCSGKKKPVATVMFQRPNQVFELSMASYSAHSKQFDLFEWSPCDNPGPYGKLSAGPKHPYRTFSRHRYDINTCIIDGVSIQ